jgi:GNAT superfamily N-acetyltransferase
MHISEIHLGHADDAWYDVLADCARVDEPEHPPVTRKMALDQLVPQGPEEIRSWLAYGEDGDAVGLARLILWPHENAHLVSVDARVRPALRRRGIGGRLVELAVQAARAAGRTTAIIDAKTDSAGERFATGLGYTHAFSEVRSLLRLSDVDKDAVTDWAAGAEAKTDGLTLVPWLSHVPEEVFPAFLRARASLNDMPMEDLDVRPEEPKAEVMRAFEQSRVARGYRWYGVGAYDAAAGAMAGLTTMNVDPGYEWAHVGTTVVQRDYRGRGVGLWVKAAMIQRLAELEPHVTGHITGNAAVNGHMRRINERLGYRVLEEYRSFQRTI